MHSLNDKLQLNAALERLVAREDEDGSAMRAIIAYGDKLDEAKAFSFDGTYDRKSKGDAVTGHTPEQGNVTIDGKEEDIHKECTLGFKKDRVGHFKIWKASNSLIKFHYFWKSDRATQVDEEDMPEVYHLGYNTKTLEPVHFGFECERTIFIFWLLLWFRLKYDSLVVLFGKESPKYCALNISITSKF